MGLPGIAAASRALPRNPRAGLFQAPRGGRAIPVGGRFGDVGDVGDLGVDVELTTVVKLHPATSTITQLPRAVELAGELGRLPLALEQAAAYMQATGDNLASYLASFRQQRPEMLARGQPTGCDRTVVTTWGLAFGQLQQSAPAETGLLRLLACCAPEAIPLYLLLQPPPPQARQTAPPACSARGGPAAEGPRDRW
jgi:hypothetical protein